MLGLIHVRGYLWKATFFHKEGSEQAQSWVTERLNTNRQRFWDSANDTEDPLRT